MVSCFLGEDSSLLANSPGLCPACLRLRPFAHGGKSPWRISASAVGEPCAFLLQPWPGTALPQLPLTKGFWFFLGVSAETFLACCCCCKICFL